MSLWPPPPQRSCLDVWSTPNDSLRRSPHEFLTVTCLLYPQRHYHIPLPCALSLRAAPPPPSRLSSAVGQGKTGNACALFSLPLTGSLSLSHSHIHIWTLSLSLPHCPSSSNTTSPKLWLTYFPPSLHIHTPVPHKKVQPDEQELRYFLPL